MPSKTPKQAKFMRAIAHGWKPSRMKSPPSRAVAQEFVDADRKYSGGFAENRYSRGGLSAMGSVDSGSERQRPLQQLGWEEGGDVDYRVPDEPGVYEAPNVEEMGPALEQMFGDMDRIRKGREGQDIDFAWDKTASTPGTEMYGEIDEKLSTMSGPEQVEFVKPRLLQAMKEMKIIGESEKFKRYSIADYFNAQHHVNQWRSKWTEALQQQARESKGPMPTEEELTRIGIDDEGNSIMMEEEGMARGGYAEGGKYGIEPLTLDQVMELGGRSGPGMAATWFEFQQLGWTQDPNTKLFYPPEQTIAGTSGTSVTGPSGADVTVASGGPRRGGRRGGRGGRGGGDGGGGPGGGGGGPGGPGTAPPRIIPTDPASYVGGTTSGTSDGGGGGSGEGSEYRKDLRKHQNRIEELLLGSARGGHVNYYQEGGAVRPGHAEGPNPYPADSARYRLWERENHIAPPPPPAPDAPPEEISWWKKLMGYEAGPSKTDEALEAMGEARGGRVNYQTGGLAIAAPAGGVPPWIAPTGSGPGYMDEPPPGYQFGGIANRGQPAPVAAPPAAGPAPATAQPYRGVPPQRGMISSGAQPGGLAAMMQRARQQQGGGPGGGVIGKPMPGPSGPYNPGPFGGGTVYDDYNPDGSGGIHGRGTEDYQRRQAEMRSRSGDLMDRIGVGGGRFGEGMRRARNRPTYQDYVNSGGGFMPPTPEGGGMMDAQVVPPGAIGGSPNRPIYGPGGPGGPGTFGPGEGIPGGGNIPPWKRPPGGRPAPPPGKQPGGGSGPYNPGPIEGGPRVPPNMRGYLQKQRMMNRPPSGPVGGGGNRVGMADQQGALSRAMQRGTGRPPMSRRGAFGRAQ